MCKKYCCVDLKKPALLIRGVILSRPVCLYKLLATEIFYTQSLTLRFGNFIVSEVLQIFLPNTDQKATNVILDKLSSSSGQACRAVQINNLLILPIILHIGKAATGYKIRCRKVLKAAVFSLCNNHY